MEDEPSKPEFELLTRDEASVFLRERGVRTSAHTLANWASTNRGPAYENPPGSNKTMYRRDALERFAESYKWHGVTLLPKANGSHPIEPPRKPGRPPRPRKQASTEPEPDPAVDLAVRVLVRLMREQIPIDVIELLTRGDGRVKPAVLLRVLAAELKK